jgi:uncharacterized membrane protein
LYCSCSAVPYFVPFFALSLDQDKVLASSLFLQRSAILSKVSTNTSTTSPWKITTERIVIAGVLAAITIILGVVPGLGFIPIPNTTGSATTEHIPTILGGVVAGPLVGIVSGLIFGLLSFLRSTTPLFKDPLVAIVPRLFIGLVAWAVFAGLVRFNRDVAAVVAGFLGSATNTVLVLSIAVARGYIPAPVVITIIPQAIIEAIVAALLTVILARVFYILEARLVRAPDTKPREELPY